MNSNNNRDNDWPTSEQKLLLQAALLQGEEAINSWEQWRASVDIEALELESYQLLPLLYRNLSVQGVTDLHMARLKGVYRRTWSENQLLFHQLTAILHSFQDADIKTLLLKDAALNLHHYEDYGLRMIHNFEILVHPTNALLAIDLLHKSGWNPKGKIPNKILPFTHILVFTNKSGQSLNLRWHLFGDGFQENAEKDFWNSTILSKVGESSTYVLNQTEQLLYICVYGALWNPSLPLLQLADAAMILKSSQDKIDWNRLLTRAQNYRLVLPFKDRLMKAHEILKAPIPVSILQAIQNLPVSEFEYREHQVIHHPKITIKERFLMRYFQYSRAADPADFRFRFLGFPRYLQYIWGLEHLWDVPLEAASRGIKRLVSAQNIAKL